MLLFPPSPNAAGESCAVGGASVQPHPLHPPDLRADLPDASRGMREEQRGRLARRPDVPEHVEVLYVAEVSKPD